MINAAASLAGAFAALPVMLSAKESEPATISDADHVHELAPAAAGAITGLWDYRNGVNRCTPAIHIGKHKYSCFVDGKEIQQVWFFDTERGIVKSYDVLLDGRPYTINGHPNYPQFQETMQSINADRREVEVFDSGLLSVTIRGKVEVRFEDLPAKWAMLRQGN